MRILVKQDESKIKGWNNRKTSRPASFMMTTKFPSPIVIPKETERYLDEPLDPIQERYLYCLGPSVAVFTDPHAPCMLESGHAIQMWEDSGLHVRFSTPFSRILRSSTLTFVRGRWPKYAMKNVHGSLTNQNLQAMGNSSCLWAGPNRSHGYPPENTKNLSIPARNVSPVEGHQPIPRCCNSMWKKSTCRE